MLSYFDFYTFIGKDIVPPGGAELVSKFMDEAYFSSRSGHFKYLDVGSHTGTLSRKIASLGKHGGIYGIDVSQFSIDRANQICKRDGLKRIEYRVESAEKLKFEDEYFDYIDLGMAFGFFIQDKAECLKECKRVLKKDGRVFFNSLFYVDRPHELLATEVDRILGIDLDRSAQYDYNFFYDIMDDYFELEKELIIEYAGTYSEADFERSIREEIKNTDAAISNLSPNEQEIFIKEYAKSRYILQMNEQYCLSAIQAWKMKS
jgi:ubiquinone/menaquinone biosynthesis C-methylase UbiE